MVEKKRTLRDAVREAKPKHKNCEMPVVVSPSEQAPVAKTWTTVPAVELVAALCGHNVEFDLGAEKHRAERREKITDRKCFDCRQKAMADFEARRKAEAAERRKNRPIGHRDRKELGRLPHGSVFGPHVYDAGEKRWTGTLTIPIDCGEPQVFVASASGIFPLHSALDAMYRKWVDNHSTVVTT